MQRVSRADPFARALVSGLIASTAMQLMFGIGCGVVLLTRDHGPRPSWAATAYTWIDALPRSGFLDPSRPALYQAIGLFLAAGLLWAIVYVHSFEQWLSGPRWERGLIFACIPWMFAVLVLLPLVHGGLFGLALRAGPLPVVGSLALYALYGLVLAELAGPLGDMAVDGSPSGETHAALLRSAEMGAAAGVVAGLALGAAVGLVFVSIFQPAVDLPGVGMSPLAVLAAATVTGAAAGALIGSFVGLARPELA